MKNILALLLTMLLIVASCTKTTYQDGAYSAEFQTYDTSGYKPFLEITLESDVIKNAIFDYKDADGNLKTDDAAYNAAMDSVAGIKPATFCPLLEAIISNTKILPEFSGIDGVSGATTSSNDAALLLEEILDSAKEGDTEHISIPRP